MQVYCTSFKVIFGADCRYLYWSGDVYSGTHSQNQCMILVTFDSKLLYHMVRFFANGSEIFTCIVMTKPLLGFIETGQSLESIRHDVFANTSGNFVNSGTSHRSRLWDTGRILNIFSWLRLGNNEDVPRGHATWNINMIPVSSTLKQVSFISMHRLTISWITCKKPRHWYLASFV